MASPNASPESPGALEIRRAGPADFPVLGELARHIWRISFAGMITSEQIEYMLGQRYTAEALTRAVTTGGLTYELLLLNGRALAFAAHGDTETPDELKLQQLYVHPDWQGRGFGGRLLRHVEAIARERGRQTLVLTVNKRNARAIAAYRASGFVVREAATFDIGNGFVMDDYVMTKELAG